MPTPAFNGDWNNLNSLPEKVDISCCVSTSLVQLPEQNKCWSISTPCHSQHVVKPNWSAPQQSSFKKHYLLTEKTAVSLSTKWLNGFNKKGDSPSSPRWRPRYRRCQLKPRPGRRETCGLCISHRIQWEWYIWGVPKIAGPQNHPF